MNSRACRHREAGVTLLELVIFSGIATVVLLGVVSFLNKPAVLQRLVTASDAERDASKALDHVAMELRQADPASYNWDVESSTAPLVITKSTFDMESHVSSETVKVAYFYQPINETFGSLMRLDQSSPTPTTVLTPIDTPTEADPLFQIDPLLHVLMVSVAYHPFGMAPKRMVRRVLVEK